MLLTILGVVVGLLVSGIVKTSGVLNFFRNFKHYIWIENALGIFIILLFAIIFYLFSPRIYSSVESIALRAEGELQKIPLGDILWGTVGLIIALVIAFLLSQPILAIQIPYVGTVISVILYGIIGYLGITVGIKNRTEMNERLKTFFNRTKGEKVVESEKNYGPQPKVLDTSVIIDGRIKDICQSGFVEGKFIVPNFVITELQHIADSSDNLKRNRGRKGLDTLKVMQDDLNIDLYISPVDYEDIEEVDSKLLKLTQEIGGKIITNDYNLNKVAVLQKIPVLNINELANAVKPIMLPGEEITVTIIREGKEENQGLAYLDDGTMIVIENGKEHVGERLQVVATSVIQTAAGKMIFAKPKN